MMRKSPELQNILKPMTEAEYAGYLASSGKKIVRHRGRYWQDHPTGFFHPIHYMARLSKREATRPSPLCWGFRTTLRDEDAPSANGALPVHLLSDLENFDLSRIKQSRRTKIRKCWKSVELVDVVTPDMLTDQAYEVVCSDHARHGWGDLPTREAYQAKIDRFFKWKLVTLAGFVDGKLGGFVVGLGVGTTAYIEDIQVHSDALNTGIASGLLYEMIQVCRRSPGIKEVVHALHAREKESLCYFKEHMGFKITPIPSRVWLAPFTRGIIRKVRPHVHYRLFCTD